jgi:hypothetical protein
MAIGILVGVYVGKDMNEALFRKIMAIIIITTVFIMVALEIRKNQVIPTNKFFVANMGLAAGFTTMLGNLAGAFSNIYFLAMRMPKNDFSLGEMKEYRSHGYRVEANLQFVRVVKQRGRLPSGRIFANMLDYDDVTKSAMQEFTE